MINKLVDYMMLYSYALIVHDIVGIWMYMRLGGVQMVGFVPKGFAAILIQQSDEMYRWR